MTVKEAIAKLHLINLNDRLNKLTEMGAPEIVIENTKQLIVDTESGNFKVNGLARKYKVADEKVIKLEQADAVGSYYKGGKKNTVILKITTDSGVYYYDYFGNKIGKVNDLDVHVEALQYEEVVCEEVTALEDSDNSQVSSEEALDSLKQMSGWESDGLKVGNIFYAISHDFDDINAGDIFLKTTYDAFVEGDLDGKEMSIKEVYEEVTCEEKSACKDIVNVVNNLSAGEVVEITQRVAHTPDKSFTMKDGYAEKTIKTRITTVEDRGDYYYIGHRPLELKHGRHGYFRVHKTGAKKFGVVAINEVFIQETAMMDEYHKSAVQLALKEMKNEMNGYTWKVTKDGLVWSYLDFEFTFEWNAESHMLKVKDENDETFVCYWVEDDKYADCKTLDEAYYEITKATIRKANYLY